MKLYTAYAISCSWLAKTYKRHQSPFVIERSPNHVRYLFYFEGEQLPFFTLHTCKNEGLIKEFVRFGDELKLHRIGYPVITLGEGEYIQWEGSRTVHTKLDRELSTFGLFLNTKPVGILWD